MARHSCWCGGAFLLFFIFLLSLSLSPAPSLSLSLPPSLSLSLSPSLPPSRSGDAGAFNSFFGSSVLEYGKFFTNVFVEGLLRPDILGERLWGCDTVAVPISQRPGSLLPLRYGRNLHSNLKFWMAVGCHWLSLVSYCSWVPTFHNACKWQHIVKLVELRALETGDGGSLTPGSGISTLLPP